MDNSGVQARVRTGETQPRPRTLVVTLPAVWSMSNHLGNLAKVVCDDADFMVREPTTSIERPEVVEKPSNC